MTRFSTMFGCAVVFAGCGTPSAPSKQAVERVDSGVVDEVAATVEPLDAPRLARRLSLDLRGVLPTDAELAQVEEDPAALNTLRDAWLEDPRFEDRMVALYAARWRTEVDAFLAFSWEFGLSEVDDYAFLRSVGQEAPRLAARIAAEDRPYTEVVTADWTMANDLLAGIFPVDADTLADGATSDWRPARYTDGRPAAGVLSTNGLWWRYISPLFNYNRRRTAAILDLLVCEDILVRPVALDSASALEVEDSQSAVLEDRACLTCHATVEPVAATLFGFLPVDTYSAVALTRYHPEREPSGAEVLGVTPAWYGTPVTGLAGLGRAIAADSRFVDCAVETITEGLLHRPTDAADGQLLADARDVFVDNDLRIKAAIRTITSSAAYQAGTPLTEGGQRHTTRRLMVSHQLRTVLADVADFHWERGGADELDSDITGYRIMGGGIDGDAVSAELATPGLGYTELTRRVGQAAARHIVDHDLPSDSPWLLGLVTSETTPADDEFIQQLDALAWRLHAVHPSDDALQAWSDLWSAALDLTGDPAEAWAVVLSTMLRDPAFLTY